jgi:hypothetical protein
MSSMKKALAAVALFLSIASCLAQRLHPSLSFSSEDQRVSQFVNLPKNVLALLLNDKEDFPDGPPTNVHCEDHEQAGDGPRPEILCRKLSSKTGANYLVIGVGDLRGAHIVPFWLFHQDGSKASLLLKTRSDAIEILSKQFNGHAEVRSTWVQDAGGTLVTDSFRFDGKAYVRYRRNTRHS